MWSLIVMVSDQISEGDIFYDEYISVNCRRQFEWSVNGSLARAQKCSVYAIEVARRQPDGTWRWLIGDTFTIGRRAAS
jgi:hypothetical protein